MTLFYNHKDIEAIKQRYPRGTRLELTQDMQDNYSPKKAGAKGTVSYVDDIGTIHMIWDDGGSLGLIVGKDQFRKIRKSSK